MERERLRNLPSEPPILLDTVSGNIVEVSALVRMLRRAKGFTLGIAIANSPAVRRRIVQEVLSLWPDGVIRELELETPVSSLLRAIEDHQVKLAPQRNALFVYGLENSVVGKEEYAPVFGNLNLTRNLFPERCPYPLVLWLPQYAVSRLARFAPDFFSWTSGTYTFIAEQSADVSHHLIDLDKDRFENLTLTEKQDRVKALKDLLEELKQLPKGSRSRRERCYILHGLGGLYLSLGKWQEAEYAYTEALKINRSVQDRASEAANLHQLGSIAQDRGNLAEAERLYQQSLEIARSLGNRDGEAAGLHQLGSIAQDRGSLAEAERLYQQSLEIARSLGNRPREVASLHQLGRIAQDRGSLAEAERLYQQSLEIARSLGNRASEVVCLHQLGRIAQDRGNLAEAERLYQQSLEIARSLGNRASEAGSLHQLGRIAEDRGNLAEAERLYRKSLKLVKQIGIEPKAEIVHRSLARLTKRREKSN